MTQAARPWGRFYILYFIGNGRGLDLLSVADFEDSNVIYESQNIETIPGHCKIDAAIPITPAMHSRLLQFAGGLG